ICHFGGGASVTQPPHTKPTVIVAMTLKIQHHPSAPLDGRYASKRCIRPRRDSGICFLLCAFYEWESACFQTAAELLHMRLNRQICCMMLDVEQICLFKRM